MDSDFTTILLYSTTQLIDHRMTALLEQPYATTPAIIFKTLIQNGNQRILYIFIQMIMNY